MPKNNEIEKLVNGEVADATILNQIVLNAGTEAGAIPYSEDDHQRDTLGSESLGSAAYPWGNFCISRDKYLMEIETTSNTVASQVAIKDLRKFISQKDTPDSYSGEANKYARVNPAEDGIIFDTAGIDYDVGATEYLIESADTEGSSAPIGYTKKKEIVIIRDGTLRIDFDIRHSNGSGTCYARVYRNGVAVGTEQSNSGTSYVTKTEDISGWSAGDLCQLYIRVVTASAGYWRNFRLYATIPSAEIVNLDT